MMPYGSYQLYQTERAKTHAEVRRADELIGRLAQISSAIWLRTSRALAASDVPVRPPRQLGAVVRHRGSGQLCDQRQE